MNDIVIIVGSKGQDGKILYDKIKNKFKKIILINKKNFDITDKNKINNLVKLSKPSMIYYLAAFHNSSEEQENNKLESITNSYNVNYNSPKLFLHAINQFHKKCKFFYASSSLIFKPSKKKILENSAKSCDELYSFFKFETMKLCKYYRDKKKLYINIGILFNHESEYRKDKFLSKKIILQAIKNYRGSKSKLVVANMSAKIDWSYAYDVIDAILEIQTLKKSDEYIISSGKGHTIEQFIKITYNYFGLNYKDYVKINKNIIFRKSGIRIGDPSKIKKITGWKTKTSFKKMIYNIIDKHIKNSNSQKKI